MTAYTYTSPQDGSTLDAGIDGYTPTTNYGAAATYIIGEPDDSTNPKWRAWLSFPGLNDATITPVITVSAATLYLYHDSEKAANARNMEVYRCRRTDVVEAQVTWDIYKTANNWGTAGAGNTSSDVEATSIGTLNLSATEANGWKAISLDIAAVQDIINGVWASNAFILKMATESDDAHVFRSSEHATSSTRPYIVVEYSTGGYPKIMWL